jgi:hypothetical protein
MNNKHPLLFSGIASPSFRLQTSGLAPTPSTDSALTDPANHNLEVLVGG